MPSIQFFRQRDLAFIREGWVIYGFAKAVEATEVCLGRDKWPDAMVRRGEVVSQFEITEAMKLERKRGDEDWSAPSLWRDRVDGKDDVISAIKFAAQKKAKRGYPRTAGLIIYANVDPRSGRAEVKSLLHDATLESRDLFTEVWVLWGYRFYLVWRSGVSCDFQASTDIWAEL
jgi:hypothetical protein